MGAVGSDLSPSAASKGLASWFDKDHDEQAYHQQARQKQPLWPRWLSSESLRQQSWRFVFPPELSSVHRAADEKHVVSESPFSPPPSWLPVLIPAANRPICGVRTRSTVSLLQTAGGSPSMCKVATVYSGLGNYLVPLHIQLAKKSPTSPPPPVGLFYISMMLAGGLLPVWAHQDNPVK